MAARCPGNRIALGGFSQGASAVSIPVPTGSNVGQLNLAWAAIPYEALGGPSEEDLPGTVVKHFAGSSTMMKTSSCVNSAFRFSGQAASCS